MITLDRFTTWALALGAALAFGASYLLDSRSEAQIEQAQAADLADAKLAAQHFERDLRACKKAMGPSADLVQIAGTDHYACREMPVEPTPATLLQRYAQLGGGK